MKTPNTHFASSRCRKLRRNHNPKPNRSNAPTHNGQVTGWFHSRRSRSRCGASTRQYLSRLLAITLALTLCSQPCWST